MLVGPGRARLKEKDMTDAIVVRGANKHYGDFAALDTKVRDDLRAWLRRLHDEVHVTTVLVTHDQAEALDVADRIAVLNKGRIEQVGSPTEVYDTPANAFVMSFLGAVSSLNGSLVRPHDIRVGRNPELPIHESDTVQ